MDIASARALKAEILERVIAPALELDLDRGRLVLSSRAVRHETGVQPGVALGIAKGRGKDNFKLAVRLQSRAMESRPDLRTRIEEMSKGEIDFRYVGRVASLAEPSSAEPPLWHRARSRPMRIGSSIAHFTVTAGTIGAFATHRKTQKPVILSNNHVLANQNRGKPGDDILQPGSFDGGRRSKDVVGELLDFVALKSRNNLVDAAISSIASGVEADRVTLTDLGDLASLRTEPIEPGEAVAKVGRTTGVTRGIVTAVEVDEVAVDFDIGRLSFDRQIEIEGTGDAPFSQGGDSGSLIVDENMRACALLFAGGDQGGSNGKGVTYANEIELVLDQLNLQLA